MKVLFKTLFAFRGDISASQLSFEAGEVLVVENITKANVNGWAMGRSTSKHHANQIGWFPLTYVQQIPAKMNPFISTRVTSFYVPPIDEMKEDCGFEGVPMSGSS